MTDDRGGWGPLAEPYHSDKQLAPDAPPWRENVFFAFWDREQRVYGTSHFTGSSNAGGRRSRCSLVVDGRPVEIVEPMPLGEFGSPGVALDLAGRVRAESEAFGADLHFVPGRPPADYSQVQGMPGLTADDPIQHFQQSGAFSGTVSLPGTDGAGRRDIALSGSCVRDRTWGYREETQSWLEYYACFLLFDDFDALLMKFHVRDGSTRTTGFVIGDRSGSVTGCSARRNAWGSITGLTLDADGGTPLALSVAPAEARIFVPLGEPDGPTAITVYDEFVQVTAADGQSGFGLIEQGILRRLD